MKGRRGGMDREGECQKDAKRAEKHKCRECYVSSVKV